MSQEFRVVEMTIAEFEEKIAPDERYLRIEFAPDSFKKSVRDIDNVVGFVMEHAIVVTDLNEQQVEYYREQRMNKV